jgi:hypothetical protein
MENISLKPSVVLAALVLGCGLAICDVSLLIRSLHQGKIIDGIARQQAATLPTKGQALPMLSGVALKSGQGFAVLPKASPPFALLIFREGCHYCEANWKNWDKLFGQDGVGIPVILATADKTLSQSYRDKHELLNNQPVMLGIDPATLASLKLGATPQTVYVVDGKVHEDWVGVLANEDMKEIKKTMSSD